jgi:hypothetical protein
MIPVQCVHLTRFVRSAIRLPLMVFLSLFDALRLGMMVNIHARKS